MAERQRTERQGASESFFKDGEGADGGPEGLPPVSSGPVAAGAHVSVAPPDPEQLCYVQ